MGTKNQGQAKYDVWITGLPDEHGLQGVLTVKMMRRSRAQNADTLVMPVATQIEVLSVTPRRRKEATDSVHRELAVEVVFPTGVPHGRTNRFDDGKGLAAFEADTRCTLVYWPSDQMARVSRHSEVLLK